MARALGLSVLSLAALVALAAAGRIEEWPLQFPNVTSRLEGVPLVDPPRRTAGYFKLNRTADARMFYFFFESRHKPSTDPVVLWMTGGPGCSSELAIFYEQGPYTINKDMTLSETEHGWDRYHNMIFVDQPIGTGFSYSNDEADTVHDEHMVGEDMLDFLQEFFKAHPELAHNDFFITGESYAGHYVPAVAHRVWLAKKNGEGKPIKLKGIAIGNGLTDPAIQFGAYADFAAENNLIPGLLADVIDFFYPATCGFGARFCAKTTNWPILCAMQQQLCMATTFSPILTANPNINVYDYTKTCDGRLCYDFTLADKFLNLPSTRKALGVGDIEWVGCSPEVYANMLGDWLFALDDILPEMMDDGVRVMIYAGELDIICNWLGNYRWMQALEWSGQEAFNSAPQQPWSVDGELAGLVQGGGLFQFVKVFEAGHMVPMDQPANALAMITSFTRNEPLVGPSASAKLGQNGNNAVEGLPRLERAAGRKGGMDTITSSKKKKGPVFGASVQ